MNNRTKIKLLSEIEDLIMELNGIEDFEMRKIGITVYEYENPTKKTVQKLKNYIKEKQIKEEKKVSYGR